jgi:hypothetical protein
MVTRHDYDFIMALWNNIQETTETSAPGHIIKFYHEAVEETAKEKQEFTIEDLTEKWNSKSEDKKSSDAIRRWTAFLCSIGYLTSKPDPNDKRRQLFKTIHTNQKSRNYTNSQFSSIFTLETLKAWLKEAEKIFAHNSLSLRENIISEREITIEELYNRHFLSETSPRANISLSTSEASLTENASKVDENDKINKLRNFKAVYWSDGFYGWHPCAVMRTNEADKLASRNLPRRKGLAVRRLQRSMGKTASRRRLTLWLQTPKHSPAQNAAAPASTETAYAT